MRIEIDPGTYVAAVSGGVDSMAMLHALQAQPGVKLVVAHFDHGMRPDSATDRQLVQSAAKQYGLPFIYDQGQLGKQASEDKARRARYDFLHRVRQASSAHAIVTAHHQDDLLETVILHLLRGTSRKGFSSLRSLDVIKRPLLHLPKHQLIRYATDNQLTWREDSSNANQKYLRNYIRHTLLPRLTTEQKQKLLKLVHQVHDINQQIDSQVQVHLHLQPAANQLFRKWFLSLPHAVAKEVMARWLTNNGLRGFDRRTIERAVVAAKTLRPGKQVDILSGQAMLVQPKTLVLLPA